MKLEITKERVISAAEKCPTAKETLKTLFPEAFKSSEVEEFEKHLADIIARGDYCDYHKVYVKLPGDDSWGKAAHIVKLLGLK